MPAVRPSPKERIAWMVKQTLLGKVVLAAKRMQRVPQLAAACRRVQPVAAPTQPRVTPVDSPRGVFVIPCGPGERAELSDTIDSIRTFEPDAPIVILADGAHDLDTARFDADPTIDVVWPAFPSGGPPRQTPQQSAAFRHVLERYDPEVLCKIDTDASLTGPGLLELAAQRFAEQPDLGILGSTRLRADGDPDDPTYPLATARHERRWSRVVREVHDRALAHGWAGHQVQGGVYLISRNGLRALGSTGHLDRDPPRWTLIGEDHWYSLGVHAAGLRLGSYGGPGEPIASGQGFLPVPKEQIARRGVLAVHSVRRGMGGEDEAELRAFLRAAREADASEPGGLTPPPPPSRGA